MKAAVVTIVGRPSAGKSTLMNRLCGQKISIVSPVPQTTRNTIRGILTDQRGQLIFIDTPGFHLSERKINLRMKGLVTESLKEIDMVLYVIDSSRPSGEEEAAIAHSLSSLSVPVIVALNKVDLLGEQAERERGPYRPSVMTLLEKELPKASVRRVSSLGGEGIHELIDLLFDSAPSGEQMYPEEFYTDQLPEFRVSEIIREKAIERVHQEVPHSLYVEIADMELPSERDRSDDPPVIAASNGPSVHSVNEASGGHFSTAEAESEPTPEPRLWIRAFLVIERESQKGILIGRGGSMIKEIRVAAQREIEAILPYRVYLDLRVKVNPKWRKSEPTLKRLIN